MVFTEEGNALICSMIREYQEYLKIMLQIQNEGNDGSGMDRRFSGVTGCIDEDEQKWTSNFKGLHLGLKSSGQGVCLV
ncbi:hypothetical protein PIB30_111119 [Stylosanthes scabra]|uniref:Uncharacterized protein n=1 Tax=Stylosanthes scabra TaxID=79078 RepID=A0ABU6V002_9FABA|nr:hypothetical protein [Stylosanthes scabra]